MNLMILKLIIVYEINSHNEPSNVSEIQSKFGHLSNAAILQYSSPQDSHRFGKYILALTE